MPILKTKDLAEADPENKGLSRFDPENKGFSSLNSLASLREQRKDVSPSLSMAPGFGGCGSFLGILFYSFSLASWRNSDAFGSDWNCWTYLGHLLTSFWGIPLLRPMGISQRIKQDSVAPGLAAIGPDLFFRYTGSS
jgi:hypothetical protein